MGTIKLKTIGIKGSHHIFKTPWKGDFRINIQKEGNMAKPFYPTTSKIFYNFDGISSYKILKNGKLVKEFKSILFSPQKTIVGLLDMDEGQHWQCHSNIRQE